MRLIRRLLLILTAATCILPARPAAAQEVAGQAGPFASPISNRSIDRFSTVLKLDPDQKNLARSLYAGYRSSFKRAADEGDAALKALNEQAREGDAHINYAKTAKDRIRITREFVAKIEKLERSFLDDLKAILTPDQSANFERAERARRREVGLKFAFLAGEGVDIFQILTDLKIDRDALPALKEELDPYEIEIDRALIAKDKMLRGVFDQMEKFEGPEGDPELIQKTLTEFVKSGSRLRDIHRQFIRKASPLLPQDKQDAFDRAVKKASFPRVYRESEADKTISAAKGIADLSSDQKAELAAIAETHQRDADSANARWSAAIDDKQAKFTDNIMVMMGGPGVETDDDPLKVAREARKTLDERTIARIAQLLKPEQRDRMTGIEKETDWHGREYMPNFDEHEAWNEWKKEDENP